MQHTYQVTFTHTTPFAHGKDLIDNLCGRHDADSGKQHPYTHINIFMRDFWDEGAHAPVTEMGGLMLPLMGETLSTKRAGAAGLPAFEHWQAPSSARKPTSKNAPLVGSLRACFGAILAPRHPFQCSFW